MRVGISTFLFKSSIATILGLALVTTVQAQDPPDTERKTTEPVFRVSKLNESTSGMTSAKPDSQKMKAIETVSPKELASHPLDQAVTLAKVALEDMQSAVSDYTAILIRRERVNGVVTEPGYIQLKVRCPRQTAHGNVPFSIYMKFLKPRAATGREVIWVEGRNEDKLSVHEGRGVLALKTFHLDPDGALAMKDNRYPVYEAGLENLIVKLIQKAERDRSAGPCSVDYREGVEINKRPCKLIELVHNEKKAPYEFHKAQVFIDKELNLPIRYAAFDWPSAPGAKPQLIEEYTYVNVKVNVGLSDKDFDINNPKYKFPRR